jgi:hypothetical protein
MIRLIDVVDRLDHQILVLDIPPGARGGSEYSHFTDSYAFIVPLFVVDNIT